MLLRERQKRVRALVSTPELRQLISQAPAVTLPGMALWARASFGGSGWTISIFKLNFFLVPRSVHHRPYPHNDDPGVDDQRF